MQLADRAIAVMVVDDDPSVLKTLVNMLESDEVRVVPVLSSPKALAISRERSDISVVVSDIGMPDLNGLELARLLKEGRAEAEALEVVILTGQPTAANAVGALRHHVFDFLSKPIRRGAIVEAVRRADEASKVKRSRACRLKALDLSMQEAEQERHRLHDLLRHSRRQLHDAMHESHRMRQEVLAVVSHELRTPLIPIIGLSEIVSTIAAQDAETVRSYAREINFAGRNLLRLVEGALELLEWDAGGPDLNLKAVELRTLVEGALASLRKGNGRLEGVRVDLAGPSGIEIPADARRLRRAISALVNNAVKASPDGETVEIVWARTPSGNLDLRVCDRGGGIPDQVVRDLGIPFLQEDMTPTGTWPGLGIGLATAERIIRGHGGRLELSRRDPGPGTVAIVTLPLGTQ